MLLLEDSNSLKGNDMRDEKETMTTFCAIRDIYRMIQEFEQQFQSTYGLGLNEGMLLCTLFKEGACTAGSLADRLGLTTSNVSKVITSVERKGFILRSIGAEDKRCMTFVLTPEGEQLLTTIKGDATLPCALLEQIQSRIHYIDKL